MLDIAVLRGVHLLPFECLDEALATRIVVGIGWPAHARDDLVLAKHADIVARRVLHAAVGVMHQTWPWFPFRDARTSAVSGKRVASVRSSSQPTTFRECASRITAK